MLQQHFAVSAVACVGGDDQTGQLAAVGVGKSLQGDAAVDVAIVLDNGKTADVVFEIFAASAQQYALLRQRPDHFHNVGNVAAAGFTDADEGILRHRRTRAVTGKEFADKAAVMPTAEDLRTADTVFHRFDRRQQQTGLVRAYLPSLDALARLGCGQIGYQTPLRIQNPFLFNDINQFFRMKRHCDCFGGFAHTEVEGFAAERITERAD